MRGNKTLRILEAIANGIFRATADIAETIAVILEAPYGVSLSGLNYELRQLEARKAKESIKREELARRRQRYANMVSRLKREGFIVEKIARGKKFFALTRRGTNKLSVLKQLTRNALPERVYEKAKGEGVVVVVYDIPEAQERKRRWLRETLKYLGLKMLQKSVWAGRVKIPKEFLDDLAELKLVERVEIFEIAKSGSLEHVL
jgi:CRISPR/Cas system-associated endoribonuclease Cas2